MNYAKGLNHQPDFNLKLPRNLVQCLVDVSHEMTRPEPIYGRAFGRLFELPNKRTIRAFGRDFIVPINQPRKIPDGEIARAFLVKFTSDLEDALYEQAGVAR